jgi:hypothetical protein
VRNAGGGGDLTQARALGMSFADRFTPGCVGLGATRCRSFHGCQGIGHLQLAVALVRLLKA